MDNKLVSVVVATYNGEAYIEEQLNSIYHQTYNTQEIVIVDDASKDNTIPIIQKWIKGKKAVQLHSFQDNVGYIKNFERGIKLCRGAFVSLSDQDDVWALKKTALLVNTIGDADLVYCNSELVDQHFKSTQRMFSEGKNMISSKNPLNFLIRNSVSGHATLFKRKLLEENFSFPDYMAHDRWLAFLAAANQGVVYLNQVLVQYRIHGQNVLGGKKRAQKTKVDKRIEAASKMLSLSDGVCKTHPKMGKQLAMVAKSYKTNSLYLRIKRMLFFVSNFQEIFRISQRTTIKKFFYAFTMLYKIR